MNTDKAKIPFLLHFHPSVLLFASRLLNDEKMPPKPDLASHNLSNFLDRFVYRNAKAVTGAPRGGSIMQPLAGGDSRGVLLSSRASNHGQQSVNTEAFWRKKAEDVSVDEVFFHKYFSQIGKSKQAPGKKATSKSRGESDNEDGENEDEIWQALVDSRPEVEGNSDDESDLEMLDLDESEAELSAEGSEVDLDDEEAHHESDLDESDDFEGIVLDEEAGSEMDELFVKELQTGDLQQKASDQGEENSRQKRRRLRGLPTFASMEDYAEMLANDEDEDL